MFHTRAKNTNKHDKFMQNESYFLVLERDLPLIFSDWFALVITKKNYVLFTTIIGKSILLTPYLHKLEKFHIDYNTLLAL